MKNFAAAYVGVRFRHSPNQFRGFWMRLKRLNAPSSQTPLPEIPYMRPENVPVVCLRARLFKLPLAIMGFDSGILQSPKSPTWELKPEYNPSPRDRTYKQVYPALWQSDSVVWFSQQLTSRLGVDRFTEYVKKFEYGNQDVSGDSGSITA